MSTQTTPLSPPPGAAQVGAWKLMTPLGEGGMGSVWLAERADGAFSARVAVKLMHPGIVSRTLLERFRAERQTLAELDHPRIARLIDGGQTPEGLPWLATDYIDGQPLDQYCRRKRLPLRERLLLMLKVCAAVQYAHQRLVVHRDLKPANILVRADGEPVLLDFGIAKLLPGHAAAAAASETRADERMMTPGYAAPEQIRGEAVSTASDVYALGVILYELLSGSSPYGDLSTRDPIGIAVAVLESEPTLPSRAHHSGDIGLRPPEPRLGAQLRGDLDTIVMKALQKEPARRYGSVGELAADLRSYLDGLPVSARPDSLGYRAGKFITRHRWAVTAAALVLLALSGALAWSLHQTRQAQQARTLAEEQRQQAERERSRASTAFEQVRRLSNALLVEVDTLLEQTPGTTAMRQRLVEQSLGYLDALSQQADGDPLLQSELAAGKARLANLLGNPFHAHLAQSGRARELAEQALALRRELHHAAPDRHEATLDLIDSLEQVYVLSGVNQLMMGAAENTARVGLLDEAEQLLAGLPEQLAMTAPIRSRALLLLGQRGDLLRNARDYAGAQQVFERLLEQVLAYRRLQPEPVDGLRREAVARMKLADAIWWAETDVERALAEGREALALFEAHAAAEPGNLRAQRELGAGLATLAAIVGYEVSALESLPLHRRALEISRALLDRDADNMQLRRDLAVQLGGYGLALLAVGELDAAIEALLAAEAEQARLVQADPERPGAWAELATSRCSLAFYLEAPEFRDSGRDALLCRHAAGCISARDRARDMGMDLSVLDERITLARARRVACRERGID